MSHRLAPAVTATPQQARGVGAECDAPSAPASAAGGEIVVAWPPYARVCAHAAGARAETAEPADDALATSNGKVAAHCCGQAPEACRTGPAASCSEVAMHAEVRTAGSTDAVRAIAVPGYAVSNACDEQGNALTSASSSLSRLRFVDMPDPVLHKIFDAVDDGAEMGRGAKSRARDSLACACTQLHSFYRSEYVTKLNIVPWDVVDNCEVMMGWVEVSRLLSRMPRVDHLRLGKYHKEMSRTLAAAFHRRGLAKHPTAAVTCLSLRGTYCDDIALQASVFGAIFAAFPHLQLLDLAECDVCDGGLVGLIENAPNSLHALRLNVGLASDVSVARLGELPLLRLDVEECDNLYDVGVAGLERLTSLRHLSLADIEISESTLMRLLGCLQKLECFVVSGCTDMSDEICGLLPTLPELRKLDIRDTGIRLTELSGRELVEAAPHLISLSVSCGATCASLSFLEPVASNLRDLQVKHDAKNIECAGLFQKMTQLESLWVDSAQAYVEESVATISDEVLCAVLALPALQRVVICSHFLPKLFCQRYGFKNGVRAIRSGLFATLDSCKEGLLR
jgi:hypothetical protein